MRKCVCVRKCIDIIRMYSSRMRTARSLTVSREGVSDRELSARGGVCPGGVCHYAFDVTCMLSLLQLRLKSNACDLARHAGINPPPTEFLTHACENITLPQLLLREVKIMQNLNHAIYSNWSVVYPEKRL